MLSSEDVKSEDLIFNSFFTTNGLTRKSNPSLQTAKLIFTNTIVPVRLAVFYIFYFLFYIFILFFICNNLSN